MGGIEKYKLLTVVRAILISMLITLKDNIKYTKGLKVNYYSSII